MSIIEYIETENIRNNIFGLRDFYNMIKYICANLNQDDISGADNNKIIAYAFYRNFGGFENIQNHIDILI